jgi:hypothetical protein
MTPTQEYKEFVTDSLKTWMNLSFTMSQKKKAKLKDYAVVVNTYKIVIVLMDCIGLRHEKLLK